MKKLYSVTLWNDIPIDTDTCMTGDDFETEIEARLVIANIDAHFSFAKMKASNAPYIMLDGPGIQEIICRKDMLIRLKNEHDFYNKTRQKEIAMEAGMGIGIDAYNDIMGY